MTITITDPEDQKWLAQATPRVSSLLPSGLVACYECAHVSATFEQSDDHYNANHSKLAGRPNGCN